MSCMGFDDDGDDVELVVWLLFDQLGPSLKKKK